jgi:hypothetical protein
LRSFDSQKINLVKDCIKDYLKKIVDVPDITFPKKSTNLIAEIPNPIKLAKNIADKKKIGSIPKPPVVNIRSKILSGIRDIEIPQDPKFLEQNKSLSSGSKIVASFNVPLSEMRNNPEEFNKLSSTIIGGISNFLNSENSPISSKKLGLFSTKLNPLPKNGSQIPAPGSVSNIPNSSLDNLNSHLSKNLKVSASGIEAMAKRMSISDNKVLRDKDGIFTPETNEVIGDEIGDTLWYMAALCRDLNLSLEEIAKRNLQKLADRKARNVIQGSGDKR